CCAGARGTPPSSRRRSCGFPDPADPCCSSRRGRSPSRGRFRTLAAHRPARCARSRCPVSTTAGIWDHLAVSLVERGTEAVQGWLARSRTLLNDVDDCVERGWVQLSYGMFESERAARNDFFSEALQVARRFADRDLEFNAMAYLGASLVHEDRGEEGMRLLDE